MQGNIEVLKLLLGAGADPNILGFDDDTVLHRAVRLRHVEAVALLLQHGANVAIKGRNGDTALAVARHSGNTKTVALLRAALADEPRQPPPLAE